MITFLARLAFRLVKLILVVAVLLGVAWIFRESLLRTAARTWVVDDPVLKADAIVVLGGGRDWRPFTAADMYLAGQSTVVLVTQPEKSPSQNLLQQPSEAEINTTVLTKKGVPSTAIRPLGQNVTSTRDEALALRDWVIAHQAKDILIPTDPFHTRRARWIFQRALEEPAQLYMFGPFPTLATQRRIGGGTRMDSSPFKLNWRKACITC
ncbi:YdcF family protein [Verrucomicrobium spinosum]|uniref:YdcF family protein n=1 Tax=Verrucomicrobium spinosum TaxID=2736 RepID=UPI00094643F9